MLGLIGGWKTIIVGIVATILLALCLKVYSDFKNSLIENAKLKSVNVQLTQNIKDKNEEIDNLNATQKLGETLIQEQNEKIDQMRDTLDLVEQELQFRKDGNNQASEYLKDLFRKLKR